jgi:twitching motility protein PilT
MNVTDPTTEQPVRLLDTALAEVVELGGSDLHVAAGRAPSVRLSGALQTLT